mgnify:CR=1 FL=1
MFDITLITMGKLKEKFYLSAASEYEKRMKGYCNFKIIELPESRLPEDPSPAEIAAGLEKEADAIFSKIPKGAWFCVFTPEGKELSSEKFADKLKEKGIRVLVDDRSESMNRKIKDAIKEAIEQQQAEEAERKRIAETHVHTQHSRGRHLGK